MLERFWRDHEIGHDLPSEQVRLDDNLSHLGVHRAVEDIVRHDRYHRTKFARAQASRIRDPHVEIEFVVEFPQPLPSVLAPPLEARSEGVAVLAAVEADEDVARSLHVFSPLV